MCGIAGIFAASARLNGIEETAGRMAATLRHRGPDAGGAWSDLSAGIAFAHRRLAIIDLSPAGDQPMRSASGRFMLVHNGEIYNHQELRDELLLLDPQLHFRGHSDTEVMLAAFEQWGIEDSVRRFHGMFAFAVWDRHERCLILARDRFGEKPLYYGWAGDSLLFGSELKALRACEECPCEIDRGALSQYFCFNAVPAPHTIYKGIFKLPPATYLRVSAAARYAEPSFYWSLAEVIDQGLAQPFRGSEQEAVEELDRLLQETVRLQMISDVPLGAFLSGGIDSSTMVALMQKQQAAHTRTFSIGLHDSGYNEAESARRVAAHLGTEHTELYLDTRDAISVIPSLAHIYDEPFADSSQIPQLLLSELARRYVTVCLSGDGGDEVFGGYNRYLWVDRIWKAIGWLPRPARRMAATLCTALPARAWNAMFRTMGAILPEALRHRLPGDKLHKLAPVLDAANAREMYAALASHWKENELVLGVGGLELRFITKRELGLVPEMMYLDSTRFLPDDVLTKVDRASMANGLEVRAPFLDARVAGFVWRLPLDFKIRNGKTKWILRQLLARSVPQHLWDRPKMGFGVPLGEWLRAPLRDWAEDLLSERRLRADGFLNHTLVREKWREHLSGRRDWQYHVWDVLMFQSWLDTNRKLPVPSAVMAEAAR